MIETTPLLDPKVALQMQMGGYNKQVGEMNAAAISRSRRRNRRKDDGYAMTVCSAVQCAPIALEAPLTTCYEELVATLLC